MAAQLMSLKTPQLVEFRRSQAIMSENSAIRSVARCWVLPEETSMSHA